MMQAVWLGPPLFAIREFPKNIPKGVLLSLSLIPLAYQDILRTFKQKHVKEEDAALLLSPHMLCTETDRLWKPPQWLSANLF